ncbi:hypothetical protein EXU57_12725 [Segetibacter sp. 3557_3]|uniref:hypothetical protein n=1 Tax=Segetibacter sp. 3557_3 TaxID=2547429 RepID=UPI0010589498|nr:hypothetical protein [Segetibacter sp. 3557_3]TDH25564.1 hypothetical protein EXU57_12725 [Segetibacter sp. 3557_3]
MSLFKSILRPFVEFDDKDAEEKKNGDLPKEPNNPELNQQVPVPPVSTAPTHQSPAPAVTPQPQNTSTVQPGPGKSAAQYEQHFNNLIEEANTTNPLFQGTDLKEFIDSKIDVEAIADEETRYKTAFNVLKRTGLTKERLNQTGREYINIIDKDLKAFEGVYNEQYRNNVELRQKSLEQKNRELQELTNRIATLNNEIKQAEAEITQSRQTLTANKDAFMQAGENKKKEIEGELLKINQYFA